MSESIVNQIKDVPHTAMSTPVLALAIGLGFLILVLIIEAYKPGLITGPIRHGLTTLGLKSA